MKLPVNFQPKAAKKDRSSEVGVALNLHLNLSKGDNVPLLLRKLALIESVENTFDVGDVSEVIQMLDWQTAATDFNASLPSSA